MIVIHGNHLEGLTNDYRRYLENAFRAAFNLQGTPLKVELKANVNPFEARKPKPLTQRQANKARRERRRRRQIFG